MLSPILLVCCANALCFKPCLEVLTPGFMCDSQETCSFGAAKAPSADHTPKSRASSMHNSLGHNGELVLQVVGFMILVAGTSMYNELLRGCLLHLSHRRTPSRSAALPPNFLMSM